MRAIDALLACLRRFPGLGSAAADSGPPEFLDVDWRLFLPLAVRHRVLPAVAVALRKSPAWAGLSGETRTTLEAGFHQAVSQNTAKLEEFRAVQSLFEKEGLPILPLKGLALTRTVYAENPVRPMSDIDLLIRPEDQARARRSLIRVGFKTYVSANRWQDGLFSIGREAFFSDVINLDLHWLPRYDIGQEYARWDVDSAWREASPCPELGANVFLPAPAHHAGLILLSASCDLDHRRLALVQLLDLALLVHRHALAKQELLAALRFPSRRSRDFVGLVLDTARSLLLEGKAPAGLSKAQSNCWQRVFAAGSQDKILTWGVLRELPSWRERLLFLAGYFLPNPEYVARHHGPGLRGRLGGHLGHWRRLLSKAAAQLVRSP